MQKSGITKEEETHQQAQPINAELHKAGRKRMVNDFIRSVGTAESHEMRIPKVTVKIPTKNELDAVIESVFHYSLKTKTSTNLNATAGIADITSLYLTSSPLGVYGIVGLIASEGITAAKNYADTHHAGVAGSRTLHMNYSEMRDAANKHMKEYKKQLIQALDDKAKEMHDQLEKTNEKLADYKRIRKETEKFFSDVEKESRKGLNTVLGERVRGLACSGFALLLNTYAPGFKDLVNMTSSTGLVPFDIAVKTLWLLGMSAFWTILSYDVGRNTSELSRDDTKTNLKLRGEELLEDIGKLVK